MGFRSWVVAALMVGAAGCSHAQTRGQAADEIEREDAAIKSVPTIGDVTEVGSIGPKPISGVALVGNLHGTGGGAPPGEYRRMLEDQLRKQNVENVKELLAHPDYAMVLVNVMLPPGCRKGDRLDVEVSLPQQSKATSLRGGYLYQCPLYNYEVSQGAQGSNRLLKGHILGTAGGPLLVGLGDPRQDQGRIWEGAYAHIDSPFVLYLKQDQKFASVANMVANRINAAFPDDARKQYLVRHTKRLLVLDEVASGINDKFRGGNGMGRGETAQPYGKDAICVNVPVEYRLNPHRYLLLIRLIPLRESPQTAAQMAQYRQRLHEMLLDPQETIRAALRLEALGKDSIPALKKGLGSDVALVRFACAEALSYLGSSAGIEELGNLAEKHITLRGHCLTAMASLNESAAHAQLERLMYVPLADLRVGAFRALLTLNESGLSNHGSAPIRGEMINDTFWLHQVAAKSAPLVHASTQRRSEIVTFGEAPELAPPFRLTVGPEFVVSGGAGDGYCTIARYAERAGAPAYKQCSFKLSEVLRTLSAMGAHYPEAIELLRQVEKSKCLPCAVAINAFPSATPVDILAACGSDAHKFKDSPEFQQEVLAAQEDLGIFASPLARGKR